MSIYVFLNYTMISYPHSTFEHNDMGYIYKLILHYELVKLHNAVIFYMFNTVIWLVFTWSPYPWSPVEITLVLTACTTFMFHDSLWHHNGSWCCQGCPIVSCEILLCKKQFTWSPQSDHSLTCSCYNICMWQGYNVIYVAIQCYVLGPELDVYNRKVDKNVTKACLTRFDHWPLPWSLQGLNQTK